MLTVYRGNRAEFLAELLAAQLRLDPPDPFETVEVVVNTWPTSRWLGEQLAVGLGGIAANIRFPFPGAQLRRLVAGVLEEPAAPADPWRAGDLVWPVLELLPTLISNPEAAPLRRWLERRGDSQGVLDLARWQLGRAIADAIDDYALYRPELLLSWWNGAGEGWQPQLLALLRQRLVVEPFGLRALRAIECLRQGPPPASAALPRRLRLFGLSAMAPIQVQLLQALSAHAAIDLYLLTPCADLWQRCTSRRRQLSDAVALQQPLAGDWLLEAPGLEARFGRLGAEFQQLLEGTGETQLGHSRERDLFFAPATAWCGQGPPPLLAQLQQQLADAEQPLTLQRAPGDASLEFHPCPGRLRQVQIVRDRVLQLLAADPSLQPRDVLIMTPQVDAYAPLVASVFADHEATGVRLPWRLTDRSQQSEADLSRTVLALLALAGERLTASSLEAVLERPCLAQAFGLETAVIPQLNRLLQRAGFRWGLDAAERGGSAPGSLAWACDRLLLGLVLGEQPGLAPADTAPLAAGLELETLGRALHLLGRLRHWLQRLRQPRGPLAWAELLRQLLLDLFGEGAAAASEQAWELPALLVAIDDWQQAAAGSDLTLGAAVVARVLEERLAVDSGRFGHRSGALTVSALEPMRAIPHRVIVLMGLDAGVFPRQSQRPGFHLLEQQRRLGDPQPADQDRYVLLEALLSARDHLLICWSSRDERSGEPLPPATPVRQWLAWLQGQLDCGGAQLVVDHAANPLQRSNFEPMAERPPASCDARLLQARRLLESPTPPGAPQALALTEASVPSDTPLTAALPAGSTPYDDLRDWLVAPQRQWLSQLGLDPREWSVVIEDLDAAVLEERQRAALLRRQLERCQQQATAAEATDLDSAALADPVTWLELSRGRAELPPLAAAALEAQILARRWRELHTALQALGPAQQRQADWLGLNQSLLWHGQHVVLIQPARARARHHKELWLQLLLAAAAAQAPAAGVLLAPAAPERLGPAAQRRGQGHHHLGGQPPGQRRARGPRAGALLWRRSGGSRAVCRRGWRRPRCPGPGAVGTAAGAGRMSQPFEANGFALGPGLRLLEASAGTGKTFALAHLVLRYVSEAALPLGELLVVTFTEAAAAELRDRIGMRLQAALACLDNPERPPGDPVLQAWLAWARPCAQGLRAPLLLALEELESADITTIHGFCRRTLQRQALEAAQPPDLQVETDSGSLLRQIANDYWQQQVLPLPVPLLAGVQQVLKGPGTLEGLLRSLETDPALQLDPLPPGCAAGEPLAAALQDQWQQAWTRFTALWSERGRALEADLCAAAAQWHALGAKTTPYSRKPTRDRCAELDTWIATQPPGGDHGACREQELLGGYFHPSTLAKVARGAGDGEEPSLPQSALLEAIAAIREGPAELLLLHACHWGRAELRRRRERAGRLSFAQLLEALDPGPSPTTPLLEAVGRRYSAALIDEFQDTDPIQWRILGAAFDPQRHRIVLVGDPKQAIYRFRGGELATYRRARDQAETSAGISALAVNFRSTAPLIDGLNRLMAPGLRRSELAVPAVLAGSDREPLTALAGGQPLQLLWLGGDRQAGAKLPSRTALEAQATTAAADHAAALLAAGVEARQVCLLVSSHIQAERLRAALEHRGIASRLVSRGDVFESAAATALQRLLDALAEPAHLGRLRLLAASPLLGWSAPRLAAAAPGDWGALAAWLAAAAEQLPRTGLLAVLASLLEARGLAQLALGGRLLADLQQCAELVQARIHADQLGPAAAADWLRRLRLEPDRLVPEAHQPNSDAVDAAVAVVTVHRSKGLEYPVVICPFLWQVPSNDQGAVRPGVRWQPKDSGDPVLDLHLSRHWGPGCAARRQQCNAELAERERLAYVAATRARQLLVLAWGPAAGQQANPLTPWLFSREPLGDPDHDGVAARSDAEWLAALHDEITARQLPLEVLPAQQQRHSPTRRRDQNPSLEPLPPLALGPVPAHALDSSWGRSSYTSWTRGSHGAAPSALEEGRETDAQVAELALEGDLALEGPAAQGSVEDGSEANGPLAAFPRGAGAGDCLHRILEQFAFDQPAAQQIELAGRELERAGIGPEHQEPLLAALDRLRLTPLGGPLGRCCLAELPPGQRLHEMGFDLPLALVRAPRVAQAFVDHPQGPFGSDYGHSLQQLPIASRGFLTGSIDLAFVHQGRWWVLDWKSNWLGERDAKGQPLCCGPRHYDTAAMAALMAANHYPLQAHLYLVALHRYLRWRLPGYDPHQHLGGYAYVFLRGVPGPTTAAAQVPGVFIEQPPLERLLALDAVLEAG